MPCAWFTSHHYLSHSLNWISSLSNVKIGDNEKLQISVLNLITKEAISKFCLLKRLTLFSFITYLLEPSITLEPCLTRKAILRVVYPNLAKSVIHHLLLSLITVTSGNYLPWDYSVCCGVIIYYLRQSTHLYTASKSSREKMINITLFPSLNQHFYHLNMSHLCNIQDKANKKQGENIAKP